MTGPFHLLAITVRGASVTAPRPALITIARRGSTRSLIRLGVTARDPVPTWCARSPEQDLCLPHLRDLVCTIDCDGDPGPLSIIGVDREFTEHHLAQTRCNRTRALSPDLVAGVARA